MYILSIDQGTTGSTAVLINANTLEFVEKVNVEFPQIFPKPGWVEHNLNDIWNTIEKTIRMVLEKANAKPSDIKAIGIANQRETTCAFSKDGHPLSNAIVWQDRRTADFCDSLKSKGIEPEFKKTAGLPLDPYFSGTKMRWFLDNSESVKKANSDGDLLFGTIDTYLLYRLTGTKSYKTDVTNASRTLLMDLSTLQWSDSLLSHLKISKDTLPTICESIDDFGVTSGLDFLPDGIPICGILGDQQAALFGQTCFEPGEGKCTYGTGAFMLVNTGGDIKHSDNGLLTTVAYKYKGKTSYALEGSSYIAGACVQWLRDNLNFFESSSEVENMANSISGLDDVRDVLLLPFFTGIGSPYWKANAKAALVGLTRGTGKNEISRAALEGIALSINDLVQAMENDFGDKIESLNVDGGAVANDLLLNIQSAFSNLKIVRPQIIETTAFGAGLAAAIGADLITIDDVKKTWKVDCEFTHTNDQEYYAHKKSLWSDTIKRLYL